MAHLRILTLPGSWSPSVRDSVLAVSAVTLLVGGMLYEGLPVLYLPLVLAGGLLAIMTLRSPGVGLSVVIACQYLPVAVGGFTLLQVVGAMVGALTLLWYAINQRSLVLSTTVPPMVFMTLQMLYSLTITHDSTLTVAAVRRMAFNIIFCLLVVNLLDTYEKLRFPIWVLVLMGVLNSLVAFYQLATGHTFESRAKGLQENENELGAVAAMAFFVPFYFFLYGDRRWKKITGLSLSVLLAGGMIASISRGAILSFIFGLLFAAVRERRRWKRFLLFVLLGACAYPLLPSQFFHRFENLDREMKGTVVLTQRHGLSTRGYYNKAGIKIWRTHPVLGVGIGNYGYYFIQPDFNPGIQAGHNLPPHNLYIQALAETGTVGFLVLCWWILQAVYNFGVAGRRLLPAPSLMYLRACETLVLVSLIAEFAAGNLVHTQIAVFLALGYVCRRASQSESWTFAGGTT